MGDGGRGKGALGRRRADPGEGLRAPHSERAVARGSRSRRWEPQGWEEGERAPGRPRKEPAAGGIPEPASLPPPALTSHLSPSSFSPPSVPGGQARSSPSPGARFPPRPGATVGASDAGAAMGYEAPPGGAGA